MTIEHTNVITRPQAVVICFIVKYPPDVKECEISSK